MKLEKQSGQNISARNDLRGRSEQIKSIFIEH